VEERTKNTSSIEPFAFAIADAATACGVSAEFLRLEMKRGRLRPTRLGSRIVVTRTELMRYLNDNTTDR
jgi:hypothetical protein